jgi:predicted RNA-binding Zn-ribbon protein involved in translation (DUF1610 family)
MACGTCGHTMQSLGYGAFWCPRCGTILHDDAVSTPALVKRCRLYALHMPHEDPAWQWMRLGIKEAINAPGERPA